MTDRVQSSQRRRRRLSKRRARVVPVVPAGTRRRWRREAEASQPAQLHWLYLTHREQVVQKYFSKYPQYPYPSNPIVRAWRWYLGDVLFQLGGLVRRNGRFVAQTAGVPVWRQYLEALRLSLRLPSMPENYYKFEWYRPSHRARAGDWLHRHETKGALYAMLARESALESVAPLGNKADFIRKVESAGLAVTPLFAVLQEGEVVESLEELPRQDLFVKPESGRGGSGAQVWAYEGGVDAYRLVGGKSRSVARGELLAVLAKASRKRNLLVQPRLTAHPDLAEIALDAAPTCRMVSFTNESGAGEAVIGVFRMPAVRDKVVDNIHAGGIAAPIDIETGVLGKATDLGLAPSERHEQHPVTGALIAGRKLPYWEQVRDLVAEAHRNFAPRVIVGWDVCISPSGPVLVEGNAQPCVDLLQRPHDLPLGTHRFGELLAFHVRRRLGEPRTGDG